MARMIKLATTVTPATIATIDRKSKACGVSRSEWLRHWLAVQCAEMDYADREEGTTGLSIKLPNDVMDHVRKQASAEGVSEAEWIRSTVTGATQTVVVEVSQPEFDAGEMETLGLVQSAGPGHPVPVGPGGLTLPLPGRKDAFGIRLDADTTGLAGATVIPSVGMEPAYPVVTCSEEDLRQASETVRSQIFGETEKGD